MATGRRPFTAAAATETIDLILHAEPDAIARFNHEAPPELDRIIRKCLEKDPDNRYQSMKELFVDLKNLKRDNSREHVLLEPKPRKPARPSRRTWCYPRDRCGRRRPGCDGIGLLAITGAPAR